MNRSYFSFKLATSVFSLNSLQASWKYSVSLVFSLSKPCFTMFCSSALLDSSETVFNLIRRSSSPFSGAFTSFNSRVLSCNWFISSSGGSLFGMDFKSTIVFLQALSLVTQRWQLFILPLIIVFGGLCCFISCVIVFV